MKRIFAGMCLCFFAFQTQAKSVIVLVPGFFNSLAPGSSHGPYFSNTVIKTLSQGGKVLVASNLSPVGSVSENGQRLATFLSGVVAQYPKQPITLVTHSAGGFYAFYALTQHPDLPVQNIVTIALPYRGVEWITNLTYAEPELKDIEEFLSLNSLREFEADNALKLRATFLLPDGVRVVALAGTQPPCHLGNCEQAELLSWPLVITQKIMSQVSDGIVTLDSAMAVGIQLKTRQGRALNIERWNDVNVALEHWEMVLDASLARLVGVANVEYIDNQQKRIYNLILQRLGMK